MADAISLCMFSPSRSESGQTVRWKNSPRGEMEKLAALHPFCPPSAGAFLELSSSSASREQEKKRHVQKEMMVFGELFICRNVPERLSPLIVSLPFHLWQQWAMNLLLSFPFFLPSSLLSFPLFFFLSLKFFITIYVKLGENDHDCM